MPGVSRGTQNIVRPSCLRAAGVGAADEQDVLGEVRLGDPGLLAVDDVAAVVAARRGTAARRRRSRRPARTSRSPRRRRGDAAEDRPASAPRCRSARTAPATIIEIAEAADRQHAAGGLLEEQAERRPCRRPMPPYSSGIATPSQPSSAILRVELGVVRLACRRRSARRAARGYPPRAGRSRRSRRRRRAARSVRPVMRSPSTWSRACRRRHHAGRAPWPASS